MGQFSSLTPLGQSQRFNQSLIVLIFGLLVLCICLVVSLSFGAANIPLSKILDSFFIFDGSREHLIIQTVRLPRSLVAILVGASLGIAGAIMQGLTHNPLADPGILGIEAGAAFAVVVTIFVFGASSFHIYSDVALLGAAITTVTVYSLGSLGRGGLTPLNLTIAGAAITALLSSLTTGVLIVSQRTVEEIRFWLAGSLAGADLQLLIKVLPYAAVGLILALVLGKQITTLSLGEDIARGLGQNTVWVKITAAISVILLVGSSVAVAGPIGFVGLTVPHSIRFFNKTNYSWILPYSSILGAILVLIADIASRLLFRPQELPVGVMTALIGAPVFISLARSKVRR